MAHELIMPDPKRVLSKLDECIENMKLIESAIDTVANIGSLGLHIGGLNDTFDRIHTLEPNLQQAQKVVEEVKEEIQNAVRKFEQTNTDIGFE